MSHLVKQGPFDLKGLNDWASAFACTLRAGDVIGLSGDLGTGKTTCVQSVIKKLQGPLVSVGSPTYVGLNVYEGPPPIAHFDLYHKHMDPLEIGEFLEDPYVALIEWPTQSKFIEEALDIELRFDFAKEMSQRYIEINAKSARGRAILSAL